jgi:DNA-binding MarR family transcriptional regulator
MRLAIEMYDKMNIIDLIIEIKNRCQINDENIRADLNLSPSEYNCLLSIDPDENISSKRLSKKMGLSNSRGSRIISNLVNKGYLKEKTDLDDKRALIISLASKGKKVKTSISDTLQNCENKITSKISESEITEIKQNLLKIINILNDKG